MTTGISKFAGGSVASATTYTTVASTPIAGRLYFAAFESDLATGTVNTPTMTGYGLTWTMVHSTSFEAGRQRLTVFTAQGAAPTAGSLVFSLGGQAQRSARWVVTEHSGVVEGVVEQVDDNTGTADSDIGVTLAPFASTASATLFFAATKNTSAGTSTGAPLAVLASTSNTYGRLNSAFYVGEDLTPNVTFPAPDHVAAIALELVEAAETSTTLTVELIGEASDDSGPPPSSETTFDPVVVRVRDAANQVVAEVDFTDLDVVLRHKDVGRFVMTLPSDAAAAPYLRADGAGVVVIRHGRVLFSGPVGRKFERIDENGARLEVSGDDDTVLLRDVEAKPQPATAAPPYATFEYDVRSGPCETVMYAYLDANAGLGASTGRVRASLTTGVDLARGAAVTGRARFQTLLELFQLLARLSIAGGGGDVGFVIRQAGTSLQFSVYVPQDRSGTAKFSAELGNLRSLEYEEIKPEANAVTVGGQGEGTAREFVEAEDAASIARWGRIEKFVDRRDIPGGVELIAAASEALVELQATARLALIPVDTARLAYFDDYNVGDLVSVLFSVNRQSLPPPITYATSGDTYADMFSGDTYSTFGVPSTVTGYETVTIVDVVQEVHLHYAGGAETVTPMVGSGGDIGPLPGLYRLVKANEQNVRRTQRR